MWLWLSLTLALAAPTLGEGPQSVTVVVTDLPAGARIEADRPGVGRLVLEDGGGFVTGTFRGPAARTTELRLTNIAGGREPLFEGQILLHDREEQVVSFAIVPGRGKNTAVRTVAGPSASRSVLPDPTLAPSVRFGLGALGLGFLALVTLVGTRRA